MAATKSTIRKQAAERNAALRARRKAAGLKKLEIWTTPEHEQAIRDFAANLQKGA